MKTCFCVEFLKGRLAFYLKVQSLTSYLFLFKDPFQTCEQQVLVLHGHDLMDLEMKTDKIGNLNIANSEKDFILINATYGYIMNIEAKATLDNKAIKDVKNQLEGTKKLFEKWFGADIVSNWKFYSAIYCQKPPSKKIKSKYLCPNVDMDFIFTSCDDLVSKLQKIHEKRTTSWSLDDQSESYEMMAKVLLFFATYHPASVAGLIDTKIKDAFDKSTSAESLCFWNWTPEQKSLFDAEICRVVMTSHWSTGKTRIMFEKTKCLAGEGKKVIFVLHHSKMLEEDSKYFLRNLYNFRDNAPILLYLSLLNEIDPKKDQKAQKSTKLKESMEKIQSNITLLVTDDLKEVLQMISDTDDGKKSNIFIDELSIATAEDMKIIHEIDEKLDTESHFWVTIAKASARLDNTFRKWIMEKEKDDRWSVPSLSCALRNSKEIISFDKKEFEPNDMEVGTSTSQLPLERSKELPSGLPTELPSKLPFSS